MDKNAFTRLGALALPLLLLAFSQGGGCGGGGARSNGRAANGAATANGAGGAAAAARNSSNAEGRATPAVNDNRGGAASGAAVEAGEWGGRGARLNVSGEGAEVEFDCAHGRMGRLTLDAQGNFDVRGVFVAERGGPVRIDEKEVSRPARYTGRVEGKRMTFSVDLSDQNETAEPIRFTLTHGTQSRLMKCL